MRTVCRVWVVIAVLVVSSGAGRVDALSRESLVLAHAHLRAAQSLLEGAADIDIASIGAMVSGMAPGEQIVAMLGCAEAIGSSDTSVQPGSVAEAFAHVRIARVYVESDRGSDMILHRLAGADRLAWDLRNEIAWELVRIGEVLDAVATGEEPVTETATPQPAAGPATWLAIEAGDRQCEPLTYPTIEAALALLHALGIAELDTASCGMVTCSACGCPVGFYYLALVRDEDVTTARSAGWVEMDLSACAAIGYYP